VPALAGVAYVMQLSGLEPAPRAAPRAAAEAASFARFPRPKPPPPLIRGPAAAGNASDAAAAYRAALAIEPAHVTALTNLAVILYGGGAECAPADPVGGWGPRGGPDTSSLAPAEARQVRRRAAAPPRARRWPVQCA